MVFRPRVTLCCLFLASSLAPARADDQVRSTQEELRRRNLYFGEIDGTQSPELSEALKHYQSRKGFTASGQADPETLRSLGLLPRQPGEAPPKELDWPAQPVLRSDSNINVQAAAQSIAQDTGVSPASIAPIGEMGKASPAAKHRLAAAPRAHGARAGGDVSVATRREHYKRAEPPRIADFVRDYLRASCSNDLGREIRFYADHLDYFHNGNLDRRIVERSLRNYEAEWSKRHYQLNGPIQFANLPDQGQITVVFRVNFVLKHGHLAVKGQTENRVIIDAATEDPRIVSIQEQRIRG